jgi:hypothetical protein
MLSFCRHINCSLHVPISLLSLSLAVVFVAVVHLHEQQAFVTQFSMLVHALPYNLQHVLNVWLIQGAYWCRLAEGLEEVPEVEAKAQLMMPPTPILKDNNWPLLTVTKGFFENLAQGAAFLSSSGLHAKPTSGHYVNKFWLTALNVSILSHQPLLHACKDCFTHTALLASSSHKYPQTCHRHRSARSFT